VQAIQLPQLSALGFSSDGNRDILSIVGLGAADVATLPMPLAQALPWPELPSMFDARANKSFWWTNSGAGGPLRGFSTEGGLEPSLMVTLMRPLIGRPRSDS